PKDPEKFKHVDELLKLMSVLTHDDRFVEVLNQEGGKPENMCEVLDYVEAKGRAQGLAEGRQEGMLTVLSGLVKDGVITASEAAKRANLSQTEFLKRTKTSEE
ncbi:MAG: transposase, partial [Lachnospiraceae bacterium]|nr:transposase [Lachnospiraceae bacterium]